MATKKKMLQAAAGVSTGPEGAWDLSYAYYTPITGWDVSTASFFQSFSVYTQDTKPTGLFFKPDGTKMYVAGDTGNDINEYDLSTAWDISTASYLQNFSISVQEPSVRGVFFKPDGTKMYVVGDSSNAVNEYDLSTAWDISSASYLQNFSVSAQDGRPQGVFFRSDGTKMYMAGLNNAVYEYDLSTAWDVSTASYLQNFSVVGQETGVTGSFFKSDGSKMYVVGYAGKDVNEYDLSTAWDISTASYLQKFSFSAQDTSPHGIHFKPDGSGMYFIGQSNGRVYKYNLVTGFDVSAQEASPYGVDFKPDGTKMYIVGISGDDVNEYNLAMTSLSVADEPQGVFFKPDGTKMYVVVRTGDAVYEYDLSTAWDILTASFLQSFSVSAQDTGTWGIFFKPDGTKMYIAGNTNDSIYEYSLSTAWDISTASYSQNLSVASQETTPVNIFFKSDGTKMYVIGYTGDDVNEYDLSTAWDISTATYNQNFSVAGQETVPTCVSFKSDGTKMYVVGYTNDTVYEYNLGTAWDVSTASYSQGFSVLAQGSTPSGLFFKPDGTKMYVTNRDIVAASGVGQSVSEYDLSTAWDVSTAVVATDPDKYFDLSTASFTQSFSVAAQDANPYGVRFKPDGTKMYVVGLSTASILEYSLSTAWDVSTASYVQNFVYDAGDAGANGLSFKPDGSKVYLAGFNSDAVGEYNLGTAWDISTAVFSQRKSVSTEESTTRDVFFKPDGKKMYVVGWTGDDVNEYDLSTAWDVSTATYSQNFSVLGQTTVPSGIFFKEDGTQMFICATGDDVVLTYSLGVQE